MDMGSGALSLTPVVSDVLLDRHLLERLELLKDCDTLRLIRVTTNLVVLDRFDDDELIFILNSFDKTCISIYGLTAEDCLLLTRKNNYRQVGECAPTCCQSGLFGENCTGVQIIANPY